ncbi:MAG: riboflavin synthase [Nitrospirae bacterium CG_4_10_14_0_8_um_filter_41_23]|nr:riboflavin synthase [Nitrospirota bacterium]OIP58625.1 MAG: riboflavin synthase subunit alpha [Nitrospirae bacterium CG2_30_41_42]PIQ94889.1 MAG: riboflavin synthase [Nitrospirae bacterium CG11_big_fil_rev_8_21_14_0_20_41_14]PIV44044.1 MAG: riboflavin synthase [Nitrospirae bacterium CG02_land_8_20_14_3_00_41_53]PIW87536.1 MAG: riboflavin synthase [Nitrospirae bacterium CG_4_8_14_3_um_filter_41_47]PIY87182.1 MAG: riboflavin synthase [Nitrospirae bacterium CG_4_10_14_0_8_um_filter_41_23]PJA8
MFTGLILEMGEILSFKKRSGGAILSLKANEVASTAKKGDSISVNGVCLTVVNKNNDTLSFDLSEETLRSTNLGSLKTGDIVNLEPSLSPDSKIGGHFVTGHVDAAGRIRSKVNIGNMMKVEIEAPANTINFLVEKGSVAVDGISFTVVDILKDVFTIVIIPHTAKFTTIGFKNTGDTVNIEVDILGKYVARFLNRDGNKDSRFMKTLMEEGYSK